MKLSSTALQIATFLLGGGKNIIVHAGVCTEMSFTPVEDVNIDACLSRSVSGQGQCGPMLDDVVSNDQCAKFSDFFGEGWKMMNDITEQMADANDESKGRLPVYGKLIGGEMLYLYYTLDGAAQGKRNADDGGGRWYVLELYHVSKNRNSVCSTLLIMYVYFLKGIWTYNWKWLWC